MIYGGHGRIRSGKTLFMTAWLFINYLWGRQVYSNYHLTFPNLDELTEMGMTGALKKYYKHDLTQVELKPPQLIDLEHIIGNMPKSAYELENSTLGIDEVYNYADARLSMKEESIFFSYLLLQSGKHDVDIMVTAQQLRLEDVRIEENSNYDFWCNRIPQDMHQDLEGVHFIAQENYSGRIVKNMIWRDFHLYMNMYDTKEVIWAVPVKHKDPERQMERSIENVYRGFA